MCIVCQYYLDETSKDRQISEAEKGIRDIIKMTGLKGNCEKQMLEQKEMEICNKVWTSDDFGVEITHGKSF